jgi:hypothetical protein
MFTSGAPYDGWRRSTMAGCALPRRAFVHRDSSPRDALLPLMAKPARDIFVRPAKREGGPGFVVERCGQPPAGGVAAPAIYAVATAPELAPVNVLVTGHALAGRLEGNLSRASLWTERPVAIQASEGQVSAG